MIESAQFGISINITGKSTFELASVEVEYTAVDDTILLQLVSRLVWWYCISAQLGYCISALVC